MITSLSTGRFSLSFFSLVTVRLFNQGVDIVEVSDDGCGVPMCSRPLLALPHATNKINSIDDIYNRASPLSLGFRGEALFCLANLSARLVIATRTADDELAQKMEFRHDGSLILDSVVEMSRKVGTTVAVVKLFETVPVRQADMKRQIQNQRSRMMRIMEAYAIFSVGVCINVMDIATDGNARESRLLATTMKSTRLEETITAVLGIRFMIKLSPVAIDITPALEEGPTTESDAPQPKWGVTGFISTASPAGSNERNRNDRCVQYYCINGRPVDLPQITRLMNDIWRTTFGQSKRPSCILMFTLPCNSFDVNVSPDKRDVIFPAEQKITELMQQKISELWASQTHGKFTQQIIDPSSSGNDVEEDKREEQVEITEGSPRRFKRRHAFSHDFTKAKLQHESDDRRLSPQTLPDRSETTQDDISTADQERAVSESVDESNANQTSNGHKRRRATIASTSHDDNTPSESSKLANLLASSAVTPSPASQSLPNDSTNQCDGNKATAAEQAGWRRIQKSFNTHSSMDMEEEIATAAKHPRQNAEDQPSEKQGKLTEYGFENLGYKAVKRVSFDQLRGLHSSGAAVQLSTNVSVEATSLYSTRRVSGESTGSMPQSTRNENRLGTLVSKRSPADHSSEPFHAATESQSTVASQSTVDQSVDDCDSQGESEASLPEVIWKSFQNTEAIIASSQQYARAVEERNKRLRGVIRAHIHADRGKDNVESPSGATTIGLSKEDLGKNMTIIGQFNMGFILAHTPDYHLWILDQHACDEKYNFERLCVETKIHEQRLMAPLPIELSPTEETCVMDNMDVFEKNGFRFQVDETKPPRHRLALTALPHSGAADGRKAVQFGKEDVVALCEILGVDGSLSSYDAPSGCGTGADGSGMYGNNAVRRYTRSESGNSTARIIARLPKAIAMFASRACRGSIMIGQALNETEMKRITTRLGDLDQPWQCPHGRSTINHVGNLAQTLLNDEQRVNEYRSAGSLVSTEFIPQER